MAVGQDAGQPNRRSEHSDSWPYNKDSFVCIDSAKSLDQTRCRAAVEESYNLSYTELHCLRARKRERDRENRQRRTERDGQTDMNEQRRMDISGTQEQLSFKRWNITMPCRQRVGGGGELIDWWLSSDYDRCTVKQAGT